MPNFIGEIISKHDSSFSALILGERNQGELKLGLKTQMSKKVVLKSDDIACCEVK